MHKHQAGRYKGIYRTDVYLNEGQAEAIIEEVTELKNDDDNKIQKKTYSWYFVDIWLQYRECRQKTGFSIRQLISEYLRLKALCKP